VFAEPWTGTNNDLKLSRERGAMHAHHAFILGGGKKGGTGLTAPR